MYLPNYRFYAAIWNLAVSRYPRRGAHVLLLAHVKPCQASNAKHQNAILFREARSWQPEGAGNLTFGCRFVFGIREAEIVLA